MIRGWCPTIHAPMPSGDGLLVRVKPFGGRLPAAALAALAQAAARWGNGVVELTSRGNLQIRGVTDPPAFARAMVAAGLADADPVREARRNVVVVPPCDDALVAEAEAVLAVTGGLPAKFCVRVDAEGIWIGDAVVRDGRGLAAVLGGVGLARTPALARSQEREQAGFFLLHLPFGQTFASVLGQLALLAPEVRTTPWRAFLSPVRAPGFEERPSGIAACPGAPGCASATVPARADAALLARLGLRDLHVSGCAKGCAHPAAATTLVGQDGRYNLVRHGRAGDPPDRSGLSLQEAIAAL